VGYNRVSTVKIEYMNTHQVWLQTLFQLLIKTVQEEWHFLVLSVQRLQGVETHFINKFKFELKVYCPFKTPYTAHMCGPVCLVINVTGDTESWCFE
jgi:hypothetical protein